MWLKEYKKNKHDKDRETPKRYIFSYIKPNQCKYLNHLITIYSLYFFWIHIFIYFVIIDSTRIQLNKWSIHFQLAYLDWTIKLKIYKKKSMQHRNKLTKNKKINWVCETVATDIKEIIKSNESTKVRLKRRFTFNRHQCMKPS